MNKAIFKALLSITVLLSSCYAEGNTKVNYTKEGIEYYYSSHEHFSNKVPQTVLSPQKIHRELKQYKGDEKYYITDVFSIQPLGDGYLISDDLGGRVFQLNNQFQVLNIIGNKGDGPGEFAQARYSIASNGKYYTSGTSNKGFAVHNKNGLLVADFKVADNVFNPTISKFAVINDNIVHSTPRSEEQIQIVSTDGVVQKKFGNQLENTIKNNPIKFNNRGHILKTEKDELLFVSETLPVIQKYSAEGKLIASHNLIEHPHFQDFYTGVQERIRKSQRNDMDYLLVQDVVYQKNNLFMLVYWYDKQFNVSCNKVLQISGVDNNSLVLEQEITLSVPKTLSDISWFESLYVTEDLKRLIAFESISSSIILYQL